MLLQYVTAVAAIVLITIHLLMQGVLVPYTRAISFQHVLSAYRSLVDGALLEIMLVVVVAHGFNGLRIILLEWKQSLTWTKSVNWASLVIAAAVLGYGTRTVLLAVTGVVSEMREVRLRIQRFDPSKDKKPAFREYTVPVGEAMTVLEALLYAKAYIDHSIALRYSCRMSSCGSCGMLIDGKPKLACETQLAALRGPEVTIQPMDNFPIIRDLVVDLEGFFAHHREIMPHLERGDTREQEHPTGEYIMKPEELEPILQFTYCIKCGLCSSSCPTSATDTLFLGPQALAQSYRYLMDVRDEAGAERLGVGQHPAWRMGVPLRRKLLCGLPQGSRPVTGNPTAEEIRHGCKASPREGGRSEAQSRP